MFGVELGGGGMADRGVGASASLSAGGGGIGGAAASGGGGLGLTLPAMETSQSVTLRSSENAGFGFDICGDDSGGIAVKSLSSGGPAQASGLIQPGDHISGINIDMAGMDAADVRKLLDSLASYPLSFNVRKAGSAANLSGPGVGVSGGVQEPGVSLPGVSGSVSGPQIGSPGFGLSGGVSGPSASANGPQMDVSGGAGASGSAQVPGFGISGAGLKGPSIDAGASGAVGKPGVDVGVSGGVQGPKVGAPGFGVSGDVGGPGIGAAGSLNGPHMEINGPDIEAPRVGVSGGIEGPGASGGIDAAAPDVDVHVKGPSIGDKFKGFFQGSGKKRKSKGRASLEGGAGVDLDAGADVDVKRPNISVDAGASGGVGSPGLKADISAEGDLPDAELHAKGGKPKGGFKFHMPKIGLRKSGKYNVADASAGVSGPEVDGRGGAEFKGELPRGELQGPQVGASVGGDVQLPSGGVSVSKPDVDMDIGGGVGGDAGADITVKGPDVDVKKPKAKAGFGFEMPKFGICGGDQSADIDNEFDADVKVGGGLPKADAGADIQVTGPQIGVDVEKPEAKGDSKFKVHMPKFGFGGKGKADVDAGLPSGEVGVDVSVPAPPHVGAGIDVEGPKVDVDVDKPDVKGDSKFKVHMPKFGFGGKSKADVDAGLPSAEVGADVSLGHPSPPHVGGDVKVEGPDVDIEGKRDSKFKVHMPKFGFGGKGKADITAGVPRGEGGSDGSVAQPSLPHVGGELKLEGPDVDVDVDKPDLKGDSKFKIHMPKFGFGGKGKHDVDVNLPSGQVDADVSVEQPSPPHVGGDVKLEGPRVDVDIDKPEGKRDSKFKVHMPKFGFGGKGKADISGELPAGDAGVDVSVDQPSPPHLGGDVSIHGPKMDVDVDSPDAKGGSKFKINMPKFGFGGKGKHEVDGKLPSGDIDADIAVEPPHLGGDVKLEGPGVDVGGIGGKLEVDKPDLGAGVQVAGPSVDIEKPKVKGDGGGKFDIHLPKFGFGGGGKPKGKIDADLDAGADVDVSVPKADVGGDVHLAGPQVDVDVDKPDLKEKGGGKFNVKLPSFGFGARAPDVDAKADLDADISGKGLKGDVDVNLPKVEGAGGIDAGVDANVPRPHLEGDVKLGAPDVDVDLHKPDVSGKGGGKVKLRGPKFGFGAKADVPDADADLDIGVSGKKDKKHKEKGGGFRFSLPKFGMGGSGKAHADVDAGLPSGEVGADVSIPKPEEPHLEGDIKVEGPKVGIDVEKPEGKRDSKFKVHMPKFGFGGKGKADADVGLPSGEAGADVSIKPPSPPDVGGDLHVEGPKVDVDVDKPDLKGDSGFKINLPKFGFGGKGKADVDASLPSGEVGADVSVPQPSLPHVGAEIGVEGPKVDVDVDKPHAKGDAGFKIHMPKFGFGGKGKADVDANVPSADVGADVSVKQPSLPHLGGEVQLEGPNVDLDVDKPDVKGDSKFKIHMPKFGFGGKGKADIDANVPTASVDTNLPSGEVRADVSVQPPSLPGAGGDLKLEGPSVDVGVGKPDVKGDSKFNADLPKFGFGIGAPKGGADFDADLKHGGDVHVGGPQVDVGGGIGVGDVSGKLDVDRPDADVGADVKVTGPGIDVDKPKVKGDGGGKFGIHLPKFGFGSGKSKGKIDANLDAGADVDVSVPKADVGGDVHLAGPQVDVDIDKPDLKGKGDGKFNVKLPSFGFGARAPDVDAKADLDADISGKGLKGDVDVNLPKVEGAGGIDAGVDVDVPKPHLEGDVKLGAPDVDVDLHKPDVSGKGGGKVKLRGPKFGFGAKADVPDADADLDINVSGKKDKKHKEKGGGFRFSLPKFGLGGSGKAHADVDAGLPSGEVGADVSVPKPDEPHLGGDIQVEAPKVDIDVEKPEGKRDSKFKVHMPKFGFGGKGKADADVGLPSGEAGADVSIKPPSPPDVGGEVHVEGPKVDVDVDKPDLKGESGFKINLPKFGFGGKGKADVDASLPSGEIGADVSVQQPSPLHLGGEAKLEGPSVDIDVDKPDIQKPKVKGEGGGKFDIHLPKFGFGGGGKPKGKIDADLDAGADVDVSVPKADVGGDVHLAGPQVDVDVDKPDLKGKGDGKFNVKLPSFGFGARAPDVDAKADLDAGVSGKGLKGDVDVNLPKVEAAGGAGADIDANVPRPQVEGDIKLGAPDIDIHAPDVSGKGKGKVKGPKFGFGAKADVPDADANLDIDISRKKDKKHKEKGGGFRFSLPKFGGSAKGHGDVDVNVPSGEIGADISASQPSPPAVGSDVSLEGPKVDVDIDKPDVKGDSKFKVHMPKFGFGGKGKADIDAGADVSVKQPSPPHLEGGVALEGPKVDVDVDKPDVKGDTGFKIKMPKFGFGGKGKADVDANLPSGEIGADVSAKQPSPHVRGGVELQGPKVDVDIDKPDVNGDAGFGIHLPKFGFGDGKADVDASLPSGKVGADVSVKQPSPPGLEGGVDVHGPKIDVDVDKPDVKGDTGFGIHLPKFGFGGKGGADVDASLPSGEVGADVSFKRPSPPRVDGSVELQGPKVDVDVDRPDAKGDAGFGIHLPKFGFGGKGGADVDTSLPSGDVGADVSVKRPSPPRVEGGIDIKGPKVDVDVDKPDIKGDTGFGIHLPKFGFGGKGGADVDASLPSGEVGADVSVKRPSPPRVEGGVDIKGPTVGVDVDKPDVKGDTGFGIHLPSFGFGGKGGADVDASLPSGEVGADVSVKRPSPPRVEGGVELQGPKVDVDIDRPDAKADAGFGIHLPKFGFGGKGGTDIDASLPSGDVDADVSVKRPSPPRVEGGVDIKGPTVGVDVDKPDVKGDTGFGIHLPTFGFGGKGGADIDASLPSGDVGADVLVKRPSPPRVEGGVDIKGPTVGVDVDKPDVKGDTGFGIHLPKFGFGGKGGADVDASLPSGEVGADVSVKRPSPPRVEGGVELQGPKVDVDVDRPDIKGDSGFGIHLPKFGFGSKGKADVDVSLPSGEVGADVAVTQPSPPHLEGEVDLQGPKVSADLDKPDVKGDSKFKIHMPKFGFGGKGKHDVDASLPSGDARADLSIEQPSPPHVSGDINVGGPSVDVDIDKPDVKRDSKFKPKFGFGFGKKPDVDADLDAGAATAYVDVDVPKPELEVRAEHDVDVPSAHADVDVKAKKRLSFGQKVKGIFSPKGSSPTAEGDIHVGVPSARLSGDVSPGEIDVGGAEMGVDVPGRDDTDVELRVPSVHAGVSSDAGSTPYRRSFEPDAGVRLRKDGGRGKADARLSLPPQSTSAAVDARRGGSLDRRVSPRGDAGARFSWTLGAKKSSKPKRHIESALRMGLPTVSVAAGNFGGDDSSPPPSTSSDPVPEPSESRSPNE